MVFVAPIHAAMTWLWQWYWAMASGMTFFVLGCFAGQGKPTNWRHVATSVAAGVLWPGTLLAAWFIEQFERDESA